MPRRVLLVDDEPMIVAGLQRLLRPHREKWEVQTATSAIEALALLEKTTFDVVVSDMRMPVMDGATFLTIAKEKYPATMRLVLSGQTDPAVALRVLMVAHQFLNKPTSTKELLESLDRVRLMSDLLEPEARAAIGGLEALSTTADKRSLAELFARGATAKALTEAVERDPALSAKLLQVVNSGFFGPRQPLANIEAAVASLGSETVSKILEVAEPPQPTSRRFDAQKFQEHALAVAKIAQEIAGPGTLGETAYTAGLLHDIGKLAMAISMHDVYDAVAETSEQHGCSFEEAERRLGFAGHATLGACLLNLWGLPSAIVETVLHHEHAPEHAETNLAAHDAVYIAHRLVMSDSFESPTDHDYLVRLGIDGRLPDTH